MLPKHFKSSPNTSTAEVNINMGYEDEENVNENMTATQSENNQTILNTKTPLVKVISTGGTSRSMSKDVIIQENYIQAGHLTPELPRSGQVIPLSNAKQDSYSVNLPDQINIELPSLHKRSSFTSEDLPAQQQNSLSGASAISNENHNISVYETPTGPRSTLITPNVLHRTPFSNTSSAVASYRTALDVTPHSDFATIGQEPSSSRMINNIWSKVRHPFGGHAILEIMPSIVSSPESSTHRKSCPNHCIIGWSFIITGIILVIAAVICLALFDNTVPDHENGIHYPLYEALYALRGQSRPIRSYDLNIEGLNVDVIPVYPHAIQNYTETHHISEHGPYNIFDNDHSTYWNPAIQMKSSYFYRPPGYSVTLDLLHNYTMTAVRIRDFGNYEYDVTDCQLEVNKDGVWRLVFRHPALPPGHNLKEINGFAVWGSLWKFTVLGTASGKQPWIKEIQFFGFKETYEES